MLSNNKVSNNKGCGRETLGGDEHVNGLDGMVLSQVYTNPQT